MHEQLVQNPTMRRVDVFFVQITASSKTNFTISYTVNFHKYWLWDCV